MKILKLGDICEISTGSTDTKDATENGQYPFFDRSKKVKASDKYLFDCEALIMPGEGAEFLPRHYIGKFDLHQRAYAMYNFSDLINPQYLYYFLISVKEYFADNAVGATVKSLRRRHFTDLEVPLPSLEKQREIVEKLDSAFVEIDLLEGNLGLSSEKTNQLEQSLLSASFAPAEAKLESGNTSLNQSFAMKLLRLRDVCVFNPPKSEARNTLSPDDLVSFMPMQDLGIESISAEASSSKPLTEVIKAYTYFAENDVLIAKITPCFENGKMGIARNLVNGMGFGSSEYFVLRPTESVLGEYLYYFLRQEFVIENGRGIMTGAVGHRRVPAEYLENLEILIPSLARQREIVEKLNSAFGEIEVYKSEIKTRMSHASALRQSLLSSAFSQVEAVA